MLKSLMVVIFLLITSLTSLAATQKLNVPRLKSVGKATQHFILAQTAPELVERRTGISVLRRFYISQWGSSRYEYGMVQYQCKTSTCEMLGEPVALKFYRECSGFKKNATPNCHKIESVRVDVTDPYSDVHPSRDKRQWFTCEDYGSCLNQGKPSEIPKENVSEDPNLSMNL